MFLANYCYLLRVERIPNILSTLRIILAPIFLLLYIQDEVVWRALSIGVFAVALFTDFFDGYIARLYGVQSPYGVFLDPLADKILTFAGFICLPFLDPQQFPWWAIAVIVFRDILVTGMRILADYRSIMMDTRFTAKLKTMSQMIFLGVVLMVGVFVETDVWLSVYCQQLLDSGILGWLMILIVILTVYSGLEYIVINLDIFRQRDDATSETDLR